MDQTKSDLFSYSKWPITAEGPLGVRETPAWRATAAARNVFLKAVLLTLAELVTWSHQGSFLKALG